MLEVLCGDNKEIQNHLNKWISNMSKGNKNDCALVLKTLSKGVGKSTFTDFFIQYVLGNDLHAKGDKECLCTANNMDLMGKPFCNPFYQNSLTYICIYIYRNR